MSRQFTEEEARRVFARVAEMQGGGGKDVGTLSVSELREAARAAGLDPSLVAVAVADLDAVPERETKVLGAPAEVTRSRIVSGPLGDDAWTQMVKALRAEFDEPGVAGQIGRTREWSFTTRSAIGNETVVRVSAEPAAGGTRLTISDSIRDTVRGYMRGGTLDVAVSLILFLVSFLGVGTLVGGDTPNGQGDVHTVFLAALLMVIGLLLVGGVQVGARVWSRQREKQFDRVLDRLDVVSRSAELEGVPSGGVESGSRASPLLDLDSLGEAAGSDEEAAHPLRPNTPVR